MTIFISFYSYQRSTTGSLFKDFPSIKAVDMRLSEFVYIQVRTPRIKKNNPLPVAIWADEKRLFLDKIEHGTAVNWVIILRRNGNSACLYLCSLTAQLETEHLENEQC